jgi:hypothetical protein
MPLFSVRRRAEIFILRGPFRQLACSAVLPHPQPPGFTYDLHSIVFVGCSKRRRDGKAQLHWRVVANRRLPDQRVVPRQLLYLGELKGVQEADLATRDWQQARPGVRVKLLKPTSWSKAGIASPRNAPCAGAGCAPTWIGWPKSKCVNGRSLATPSTRP